MLVSSCQTRTSSHCQLWRSARRNSWDPEALAALEASIENRMTEDDSAVLAAFTARQNKVRATAEARRGAQAALGAAIEDPDRRLAVNCEL